MLLAGWTLDWIGIKFFSMAEYPKGRRKNIKPKGIHSDYLLKKNPSSFVLKMLLSASPYYVSGSLLAEKLNMSRVGVWSRINKLRKQGLVIEATQNRGYRIAKEPDYFNLSLIKALLSDYKDDFKVIVLDKTDSTNSEAERLLANGEKTPFAILANMQRNGRGRLGKEWHSPREGNLYLSIAFRPEADLEKLRTFTLFQGVRLCNFLRDQTGIDDIYLKWPNDLVWKGKKMGGMLTEASIDFEQVKTLIFGLGLNINGNCESYPSGIKSHSTSLVNLCGEKVRLNEVASKIIKTIILTYNDSMSGKFEDELQNKWASFDFLKGKKVEFSAQGNKFTGKADGIDFDGSLRLKLRNGRMKKITAGEISIKK